MSEFNDREKLMFSSMAVFLVKPSKIMFGGKPILMIEDSVRKKIGIMMAHHARMMFKQNLAEFKQYQDEVEDFNKKFSEFSLNNMIDDQIEALIDKSNPESSQNNEV